MRKMKKINGYLVVKFNARELRKALRERVGELAEMMEDNYAVEQYRKGGGAK